MKLTEIYLVTQDWKGLCEHNFVTTLDAIKEIYPECYYWRVDGEEDGIDYADRPNITYFGKRCSSIAHLKSFVLCEENKLCFEDFLAENNYDSADWEDWYCDLDLEMCDKSVLEALPLILEESAGTSSAEDIQIIKRAFQLCS